ncbi:hypothetical protein [Yeosuana marina]|uniref:hypothetical protein n=1 Tax=Yeosuana marina TaxID=1565536 RepID=UPI00142224EF|nr:hypothetical protein [Yeosuana marina]
MKKLTFIICISILGCGKSPKKQTQIYGQPECTETVSFIFNIEDMSIAEGKRTVVTVNVPEGANLSNEALKLELKCIALYVANKEKPKVLAINVFKAPLKTYKTFKGDTYMCKVDYAPAGEWSNINGKEPYDFSFIGL